MERPIEIPIEIMQSESVGKKIKPIETICSQCGAELQVADSKYVATGDNSPDTETEIFVELTMVCPNIKCKSYAGADHNNPLKVEKQIRNKMNK
ncbi:MAG: hypothetical protein WCL51_03680 [Bacteroidota bacterium]